MKPDDVTDAMALSFREGLPRMSLQHTPTTEIIAAAFNAVTSDDEPITAEWLMENGYRKGFGPLYHGPQISGLWISWDGDSISIMTAWLATTLPTKTIGQLRALHAGLGIGEVQ